MASARTYPSTNGGLLLLALLLVAAAITTSSSLAAAADSSNSTYRGASGRHCSGSIGECLGDESEWLMESGASRSLLQGGGQLSYRAINNGNQPAAGNGARGNSYTRGCNAGAYRCNNGNY